MVQLCTHRRSLSMLLATVLGLGLLYQTCLAVPVVYQYTLTDLGSLGGTDIVPNAINSSGAVVGFGWTTTSGDVHAWEYSNGSLVDLGTLGQNQSWAEGINNSGVIVGQAGGQSVNTTFTSANGTTTILPSTLTQVAGINDFGAIAGATGPSGSSHAAIYNGTTITTLESSSFSSVSDAINNSGQVAGTLYATASSPVQGYLYSNGGMTMLGTLGGAGTWVYGLNNLGQIVGMSQSGAGAWEPYLYSGGSMVELGTSGGTAYGINNLTQVVGTYGSAGGAFLYANGTFTSLDAVTDFGNSSFTSLDSAQAINDSGLIVGYGSTSDGVNHAFLLTPIGLTPVPEPEDYGMMAAALMVALVASRIVRRRRERNPVNAAAAAPSE